MTNSIGFEQQYLNIMKDILDIEDVTPDRTGTGRVRLFARDIEADLSDGTLPVVTTRKINYEHGIEELLWMIKGSSNIKQLHENTQVIWKDWAIKESDIDAFLAKFLKGGDEEGLKNTKAKLMDKHIGSIGPMYGHFWRYNEPFSETAFLPLDHLSIADIPSDKLKKFNEEYEEILYFQKLKNAHEPEAESDIPPRDVFVKIRYFQQNDQLGEIVRGIKRKPYSARHVMSCWIPQYVPFESVYTPHENILLGKGALTPCHVLVQFFVEKAKDGGNDYLSLRMYQRSCDLALGVCTNLVFYGMLLHLVAHVTDKRPKRLIWTGGDVHLYKNHLDQAKVQVERVPYSSPSIKIREDAKDLFAITREDIEVISYEHHPALKYAVSV